MSVRIIQTGDPCGDERIAALRDVLRGGELTDVDTGRVDVGEAVRSIIADVRRRGDDAVAELTSRFDGANITPQTLRVPPERIRAAHAAAEDAFLRLVRRVADNIRQYQERILLKDPPVLERGGRRLGLRYTPVDRVAVYVPGGRAIYPSSVLMTLVPAQVAGVGEIAMVSPPTCDGDVSEMLLALAGELGVDEIYRAGGAVGIAAVALGTETIPPVCKVAGPGNAFVAEAKRQLFGIVGIDSIAGPSEVLIIADQTARPDWLAVDMLAQAEHDPASAVLVTTSLPLARQTAAAIDEHLATLERADAARASLDAYGAILVVDDMDAACRIANDFAPEHLQIITADDQAVLAGIRNAGAVFLGPHTPVALGDYYAGPSHVLPTGGTAKFFSPLSCNDFLKATSIVQYDAASMSADADDVIDFATREGLTAHARSAQVRTDS